EGLQRCHAKKFSKLHIWAAKPVHVNWATLGIKSLDIRGVKDVLNNWDMRDMWNSEEKVDVRALKRSVMLDIKNLVAKVVGHVQKSSVLKAIKKWAEKEARLESAPAIARLPEQEHQVKKK